MMVSVAPTVDNTWGAALIGLIASNIIYGITTLQLYIYCTHYPNDARGMKLLAWSVWIIDTVSLILVCNGMYGYLVSDMAHPERQKFVSRSLEANTALMGLLPFLTHSYLGRRVWKVCQRNVWFGCILFSMILISLSLTIVMSVLVFRLSLWTQKNTVKWLALAGTILVVVIDAIIATVLCVYLLLQKVQSKGMTQIIRRVVIFSVNTGLVSSLVSIVNIVTFLGFPDTLISIGSSFLFTKVYANALLANLNARESLRGRGYANEGTITINWSGLRTRCNDILVFNEPETATTDPSCSLELSQPSPTGVGISNPNETHDTGDCQSSSHRKV